MTEPGSNPPLVLFEDEHLLVVNKPAGWNTHAPSPFAGEGLYDWLRHREPRWAKLAIIHRLDKETSGVLVFGKTPLANRSLTAQFTEHTVTKVYHLLTDRPVRQPEMDVVSTIVRAGERYVSRPWRTGLERAETRFRVLRSEEGKTLLEALPRTGRTHQIRVHAAANGFPVLGDTFYGGSVARRVCLHAETLILRHPATGEETQFHAPSDFAAETRRALRQGFIDSTATNTFRHIHGASDGWPGWAVDQLGDYLLSQSASRLTQAQREHLDTLVATQGIRGVYHKTLEKHLRRTAGSESSPRLVSGDAAPDRFVIRENGVKFELSFNEGYSVGLFLDQRDNRRRLLVSHIAADFPAFLPGTRTPEVLNTFAYTCGFSVCAAKGGARVMSVDLSKKYLEWGRRNFVLNELDPLAHEFLHGDVFDWLRRLTKKARTFDLIVLDPPTFSQSKASGVFRAEKDYRRLVAASLPLLRSSSVLFASTNAAEFVPEDFLRALESAVAAGGRRILQRHYVPQPPDFPITREEPGYLKTVWLRIA